MAVTSVAMENKAAAGVKILRLFGVNIDVTHLLCDEDSDCSDHHLVKKPKHSPIDDHSQEKDQNKIIIDAQPISYFNPNTQLVVAMNYPTLLPPPPPKLTQQQMLDHIEKNLGGSEIKLVIQKRLKACDLKEQQGRLSMPRSRIQEEFLRENEKEWLNAESMETNNKNFLTVRVIGSRGGVYDLCLTKWDYSSRGKPKDDSTNVVAEQQKRKRQRTSSGGPGCSYVLLSGLKKLKNHTDHQVIKHKKHRKPKEENPLTKLKEENDGKEGEVIQIFSFRKEDKLCFAIVS